MPISATKRQVGIYIYKALNQNSDKIVKVTFQNLKIMSEILIKGRELIFPAARLRAIRCAIGPTGTTKDKREGDGATPIGKFTLRKIFYRQDRVEKPTTKLPVAAIRPTDGWCDDPDDPLYNKPVTLPYAASAETMYRDDHLYDICVIVGHNDDPPLPGKGSAIFFHLAHDDYRPTQGCVAIAQDDMVSILASCDTSTILNIQG